MNKYIRKGVSLLLLAVLFAALAIPAVPAVAEETEPAKPWYEPYKLTWDYLSALVEGEDYSNVVLSEAKSGGLGQIFFNSTGKGENFVYLGDFDLSEIGTISSGCSQSLRKPSATMPISAGVEAPEKSEQTSSKRINLRPA